MLSFTEPVQIALIAAAAPLALELLRSRIKARDAAVEAEREARTRTATEDTARDTIDTLKAELSDSRRANRELRAMVNLLLTQGTGRRMEGDAPTRSHGESV